MWAQGRCKSNAKKQLYAEMLTVLATFCCKYTKNRGIMSNFANEFA